MADRVAVLAHMASPEAICFANSSGWPRRWNLERNFFVGRSKTMPVLLKTSLINKKTNKLPTTHKSWWQRWDTNTQLKTIKQDQLVRLP